MTSYTAENVCYFNFAQPASSPFMLPPDKNYEIEIIDTWNMTIEKLEGTYSGRVEINSRTPYIAVRYHGLSQGDLSQGTVLPAGSQWRKQPSNPKDNRD